MNRLVKAFKVVTVVLVLLAAASIAMPHHVAAQTADTGVLTAILAAITQFFAWVSATAFYWLQKIGFTALGKQIAANTIGTQAALQNHAAVVTEALTQQTSYIIEDKNAREFGSLGQANVNGQTFTIGSNAPSGCHRVIDVKLLANAHQEMDSRVQKLGVQIDTHNAGYGSATGALAAADKALQQGGPSVFALDWIEKPVMTQDEYDKAQKSILFATNMSPLPPPPNANTAIAKQYTLQMEQLGQLSAVPQKVLARQLALRAGTQTDSNGKTQSYLSVVNGWAKTGAEDPNDVISAQAKTPAGIEREILLTLKAMLTVENERMQSEHEANAMLAIMTSRQLQERAAALRSSYNQSVNSE